MTDKCKHVVLTLTEALQLIHKSEQGNYITNKALSFRTRRTTICNIHKNKDMLIHYTSKSVLTSSLSK